MTADAEKIAVDLIAATADMRPRFKRLANMILRLRDAHSAHTDLSIPFDTISSVAEANEVAETGDVWAMHAVPAMISSAIVLYARATKSNSRHRSTLSLSKNFTPEQLEAHYRFCRLRDDAIAHYGLGETYMGGTWHEEGVLLLVDQPANPQIVMTSRRLGSQSKSVV